MRVGILKKILNGNGIFDKIALGNAIRTPLPLQDPFYMASLSGSRHHRHLIKSLFYKSVPYVLPTLHLIDLLLSLLFFPLVIDLPDFKAE